MNTHPLTILIDTLSETKGDKISYDEFKLEVTSKYGGTLGIKEKDDLFIVFSNNTYTNPNTTTNANTTTNPTTNPDPTSVDFNCKSIIYDKDTLMPIVSQYNNILYNENAIKFTETVNWDNVVVQKCYEGTLIIVFNHNNKWYVSTRRCLDANESIWVKNNSYGQLFTEAIEGKFTFDDLDPNYCYHFILVHHKNKNIVSYSDLGDEYKNIYHILTTEKYSMNEVQFVIPNVNTIQEEKFNNMNDIMAKLDEHNREDVNLQLITLEGYVLKCYTGEIHNSPFVTLKLQTKLYETLTRYKPNNSNIYQCFLELYQFDKLVALIPFFIKRTGQNGQTEPCGLVINCIHRSMRNMAKELSNLYFLTRKKNNNDMYTALPTSYKKLLFGVHGIYLNNNSVPINALAVYDFLKFMPSRELRQLFSDRQQMLNNNLFTFLNKSCMYTNMLTNKMFCTISPLPQMPQNTFTQNVLEQNMAGQNMSEQNMSEQNIFVQNTFPQNMSEQDIFPQNAPRQNAPRQNAPRQNAPRQNAPRQNAPRQNAPRQNTVPQNFANKKVYTRKDAV